MSDPRVPCPAHETPSDRGSEAVRKARAWLRWIVPLVLVAIVILYLGTAVTTVQAGQVGLLRQFGRIIGEPLPAGLHLHLPWPFQSVEKVEVRRSMRLECGFFVQDPQPAPNQPADSGVPWTRPPTFCLTGDKNIIFARVVVHYRVKNAADYVEKMLGSEQVLKAVVNTTLLKVIGRMRVDNVLAEAKGRVSKDLFRRAQARLDRVGCPLAITSVELTQIEPPELVRGAFRDVINAQLQRETDISEAQAKRLPLLDEAHATAGRVRADADNFRYRQQQQAHAEANGLRAAVAAIAAAGPVAKVRLMLDAMEKVMPALRIYVLPPGGGRGTKVFVTPGQHAEPDKEAPR